MMRLSERGREQEGRKEGKHEKRATKRRKRRDKRDFPNGNGEILWAGDRGWSVSSCFQPKLTNGVGRELFEVQLDLLRH